MKYDLADKHSIEAALRLYIAELRLKAKSLKEKLSKPGMAGSLSDEAEHIEDHILPDFAAQGNLDFEPEDPPPPAQETALQISTRDEADSREAEAEVST